MKISEKWLREWTNPPLDTRALAHQLTMAGLEVDGIEPAAESFDGVVIGKVVELEQHPDADRLRVAKVNAGQGELLQIVCGAPNIHVGMVAPAALVGAKLPGGMKIRRSKLRGVESQGMLCSSRELGLAEDADGLMALPGDLNPGDDFRSVLGLDDQIIDVDLTPNRGDCLSMAGVAREVSALNSCPLNLPEIEPVPATIDDTFPVRIDAPEACPRYVGRVVRNVNARAETPLWMRERLRRAGLRSLGPLVDITNYILIELGQPLHAFDLSKLNGGIIVRMAEADELLTLLNDAEVKLDNSTLAIADHAGAVAIGGVMGGAASAVSDDTCDVFLEGAFFAQKHIAGRARRYGLHTDASHRYERGVDPDLQVRAIERATRLLIDIAGGEAGPVSDNIYAEYMPVPPVVTLRKDRAEMVLGMTLSDDEIQGMLTRLGMQLSSVAGGWEVTPPSFRFDIAIEEDLIEEIGRIHGYENLPSKRPITRTEIGPRSEAKLEIARLKRCLVDRGYQEAITYSFVDPEHQKVLDPERTPISLANPISSDLAVMRTTLWSGLIASLEHNQKRQQARVRLFESGLVFLNEDGETVQRPSVGGLACGSALPEQWGEQVRSIDFFDAKGDIEALLAETGQKEKYRFVAANHPALHPGQSARVECEGRAVGWIGALHPAALKALDVEGPVFAFELELDSVLSAKVPVFSEVSKFPAIRRDLSFVVPESVSAQSMLDESTSLAGSLLRNAHVFDVYRGKGVAEEYKSLTLGLILQDFSSTLTDSSVDETMSGIVTGLQQKFGAQLRG